MMPLTLQVEMLAPAAALIAWTLVVLLWTLATRIPAFGKAGIDLVAAPGGRFSDVESQLPPKVAWVAHNHNHLMEQPTIFYALTVILALTGASEFSLLFAWTYVAIRIAHSLWQGLVNTVPMRFALFALSTLCLIPMTFDALRITIGG